MLEASITADFFFNESATTKIYTLSLHDALPICARGQIGRGTWEARQRDPASAVAAAGHPARGMHRSEEHTSELQSHVNIVCRLLLEKKIEWSESIDIVLYLKIGSMRN